MTSEWVVVAASVASGVLGAIVTTYGTQARERRTARTEVRKYFQQVEQLARHRETSQKYYWQLVASLDDLEGAVLVAGMPRYLATFIAAYSYWPMPRTARPHQRTGTSRK